MIGRQRNQTEQVARQAWDHLSSALGAAESSVRSATKRAGTAYDNTTGRLGASSREARARARDAYDALMGRPRRDVSWSWLAAAAAAGLAIGWVVTTLGRRALADSDPLSLSESVDEVVRSRR